MSQYYLATNDGKKVNIIQNDRCAHFNRPLDKDGQPLPDNLTVTKQCPRCGLAIVSIRKDLLG
jgi:hypothetical protein